MSECFDEDSDDVREDLLPQGVAVAVREEREAAALPVPWSS